MNHPITIAGGGLAGLALANRLASEGIDVELFEKRRYPFHRVCGEFISGVSDAVIETLGVGDCLHDAQLIRSMAWFLRDRVVLEQKLPQPALGISRYTLDARLAEVAQESGATIRVGEAFKDRMDEGVVWATGKRLDQKSRWLGLSAHFENTKVDRLEMYCGPVGYLGMSPVEDGRVNVTGLFRKESRFKGRGVELLFSYIEANGCLDLLERLGKGEFVEDSFAAIAGFEFGAQQRGGFVIGDRSLLIPPFAGNGMSMALEAAAQASRLLVQFANGEISWVDARRQYLAFQRASFSLRMNMAARLHPLLLSSFGLRMLSLLSTSGMLPTQRLFNALR